MDLPNDYDCVIIGENPAGLWAAKLLLEQGRKVLVVPMGREFGEVALPRMVAQKFNFPDHFYVDRMTSPIQIVTPEKRFRVFSSEEALKEEHEFVYGKLLSLQEKPDADLLRGLAYLYRGHESLETSPADWTRIFPKVLDTLYFQRSGQSIIDWMFMELVNSGATVLEPGSLKQIFIDKKQLVGIQIGETSQMLPVKFGFANYPWTDIQQLLNEKVSQDSKVSGFLFEIWLECSTEFLPVGLTNHLIYSESGAPLIDIRQEGAGHFKIQTTLPLQDRYFDRYEQRRVSERMLKVCEKILPDLEYNLKRVKPEIRDPERAAQVELPELYPFDSVMGVPTKRLIYSATRTLGYQTPVQNFFLSNSEADPQNGVWGSFQAVKSAIEAWIKRDPKAPIPDLPL